MSASSKIDPAKPFRMEEKVIGRLVSLLLARLSDDRGQRIADLHDILWALDMSPADLRQVHELQTALGIAVHELRNQRAVDTLQAWAVKGQDFNQGRLA